MILTVSDPMKRAANLFNSLCGTVAIQGIYEQNIRTKSLGLKCFEYKHHVLVGSHLARLPVKVYSLFGVWS